MTDREEFPLLRGVILTGHQVGLIRVLLEEHVRERAASPATQEVAKRGKRVAELVRSLQVNELSDQPAVQVTTLPSVKP